MRGLMRYATQEFGALDFLVNVSWPLEVHLTASLCWMSRFECCW